MVTGGFDHTLRIWDLDRPAHPVGVLDAACATEALVVDRAGQRALSRGRCATDPIELWDVGHLPAPTSTLVGEPGAVLNAVVSNHRDRLARFIEIPVTASAMCSVAVDDSGLIVTGHADGTLWIWNAGADPVIVRGHTRHVEGIEIHDRTLISYSWDTTVRRWELPSEEPLGILKHFDPIVDYLTISPTGRVASADRAATVSLWDGAQGRLLEQWPSFGRLTSVAFIDDEPGSGVRCRRERRAADARRRP